MTLGCSLMAGQARALDPHRRLTQYVHDAWSVSQGLPHASVRAVVRDRQGYLWIASRTGLLRFDGQSFTPIALHPNDVLSLCVGRDGLWVGTSRPGHLYLLQGGKIVERHSAEIGDAKVEKLHEDRAGVLWVGTTRGLFALRHGRLERMALEGEPAVIAITDDGGGGLWIGASTGLVHLAQGRSRRYTVHDGLGGDDVRALVRDRSGALWVGARAGGLTRMKDGRFQRFGKAEGLPDPTVYALAEDDDGMLWVGGPRGVARLHEGRFVADPAPKDVSADQIEDLYVDGEGSLWISTQNRGLHRLRDGAISSYGADEGLPWERIWAVRQDPAGFFWLGTEHGLVRWEEGPARAVLHDVGGCDGEGRVKAVLVDSRGTLWFGSQGRLFRMRRGRAEPVDLQGQLGCHAVESLVEDRAGVLWIATRGSGLIRLQGGRAVGQQVRGSRDVRALLLSRSGVLWAGTEAGLARLTDAGWAAEGPPESALTLFEDHTSALWIGGGSQGLERLVGGRRLRLTQAQGLPCEIVFSIQEDDLGRLWLMCEKGLFHLTSRDFEAAAEGRARLEPPRLFGEGDGMRSLLAFGTRAPGAWKTADGRLWFATPNGLAVVDARRLNVNTVPPPVVIESVRHNGRAVDPNVPGDFPAASANFEFHYTALNLGAPERAAFHYRLEGIDADWVDAGPRRTAYYPQLPPGDYVFRVRARNEDGVWSEQPAAFAFRKQPFLYQTPGFYALCAIGLVLLGAGVNLLRVRRMAAQQRQMARLVDARTEELREATRRLDVVNQQLEDSNRNLEKRVADGIEALREAERMAAYGQMVAAVAHEVRHPIFALQAAAYVLQERLAGRDGVEPQLQILGSETRRLDAVMKDLLEFARPTEVYLAPAEPAELFAEAVEVFRDEGYELPVDVEVVPGTPRVALDRFRTVLALLNLMRNAVQHAAGLTHITLTARELSQDGFTRLRLSVRDDGAGIDAGQLARVFDPFVTGGKGTGLGLAIVRRIVTAHGGEASVESQRGRGTVFHLDIPHRPALGGELAHPTGLASRPTA